MGSQDLKELYFNAAHFDAQFVGDFLSELGIRAACEYLEFCFNHLLDASQRGSAG